MNEEIGLFSLAAWLRREADDCASGGRSARSEQPHRRAEKLQRAAELIRKLADRERGHRHPA